MKGLKKVIALAAFTACCFNTVSPITANAASTAEPGCSDGKHITKYEELCPKEVKATHEIEITSLETGKTIKSECSYIIGYYVDLITCECGEINRGTIETKAYEIHYNPACFGPD